MGDISNVVATQKNCRNNVNSGINLPVHHQGLLLKFKTIDNFWPSVIRRFVKHTSHSVKKISHFLNNNPSFFLDIVAQTAIHTGRVAKIRYWKLLELHLSDSGQPFRLNLKKLDSAFHMFFATKFVKNTRKDEVQKLFPHQLPREQLWLIRRERCSRVPGIGLSSVGN